jgi:hypothetical protein
MIQNKISSLSVSIIDMIDRHRITATFMLVLAVLVLADALMFRYGSLAWSVVGESTGTEVVSRAAVSMMGFAPEVWVGVLALVLGTLVIVISIASQSTPKLIDLYMRDWVSLMYVWFISLTLIHNLVLQFEVGGWGPERTSSIVLSTAVFLPLSALLAVPYIFYILGLTRPNNVIRRVHRENLARIRMLAHPMMKRALQNPEVAARHQALLFDALNQLDDLLEYLRFKEPRGLIIRAIGSATQLFVKLKKDIPASFFQICEKTRDDISFKTLVGQFDSIEETRTLYSQKAFRLLGNAYMRFLERGDFELSTLCAVQVTEIGRVALEEDDKPLVELTFIRFNTLLRFGIKHGTREAELRNLYNALDQYGTFILAALKQGRIQYVEDGCRYLKDYGSKIYRISRDVPGFEFLVDVVAAELRTILIAVAEVDAPIDLQERLLDLMLQLDNMPDFDKKELQANSIVYDRVRILQASLALYYLRTGKEALAHRIVTDILEDFEFLGELLLRDAMLETIKSLEQAPPTFWEDTDRGNQNIYYSPDTEFLPVFHRMFEEALVELVTTKPGEA